MCVNMLGPTPLVLNLCRCGNCLVCVNMLGSTPKRRGVLPCLARRIRGLRPMGRKTKDGGKALLEMDAGLAELYESVEQC